MPDIKYTVRDLQIKLLEIVDYVDELCRENDINYYLIGGSALGAVRHKGFIPWDDDFDIAMTWDDYCKFIEVCENNLDTDRFYFQKEGSKGWPLYFSKLKMNNTVFKEEDSMEESHPGLFIDIFSFENIADSKISARWQYLCSKIAISQSLAKRGYKTADKKKKLLLSITRVFFANNFFESYIINQVRRFNTKETQNVGLLFGISRFDTAIFPRNFLGNGKRVEFEGRMLPVPVKTHEYLKNYFGDYMKLPPEEKRKGHMPKEIKL